MLGRSQGSFLCDNRRPVSSINATTALLLCRSIPAIIFIRFSGGFVVVFEFYYKPQAIHRLIRRPSLIASLPSSRLMLYRVGCSCASPHSNVPDSDPRCAVRGCRSATSPTLPTQGGDGRAAPVRRASAASGWGVAAPLDARTFLIPTRDARAGAVAARPATSALGSA